MANILFIGATGYIGSAVFSTLLNAHPGLSYTALVRAPEHAVHVPQTTHCVVIRQEPPDAALAQVEELAAHADVVINVASSDDEGFVRALVRGLSRRRCEKDGEGEGPVALVHTSGVRVFLEGTDGKERPDARVWDDGDESSIRAISATQPHGHVDRLVLDAGSYTGWDAPEDPITTYVVCPGLVYGQSPSGKASRIYRTLVGEALKNGAVSVVGEGSNVIGMVHINDLANLYLRIVNQILFGAPAPAAPSPYARYYIAQASERTWASIAHTLAHELKALGVLPTDAVRAQSAQEVGPLAGLLGGSAHLIARRAREDLEWAPAEPEWEHFAEWDVERCLTLLGVRYKRKE